MNNKNLVKPMEFATKCNYMLITMVERDFNEPQFFSTKEEAHDEMCKEMAEALDMPIEEIKECYLNGEMVDDDYYIGDVSAYYQTKNHDNVDSMIYNLESCGVNVYKPDKNVKYEESYVDIMNKLNHLISTDIIQPDDKVEIDKHLEELQRLLWKYSY